MKIAVVTTGGDCAGLNACLHAIVKHARQKYQWDVWGVCDGIQGLLKDDFNDFSTLPSLSEGGTCIGAVNKGDPKLFYENLLRSYQKQDFDALIAIGGDGSCKIMRKFCQKTSIPLVMIPKTIDNDLSGTDWAIGHMTALEVVVDALTRLHTTAKSHRRVFVVEVMGRGAGHIAVHAGLAGEADAILIPERSYHLRDLAEHIKDKRYAIVVVAEGTLRPDGKPCTYASDDNFVHYGGIGAYIAKELKSYIPHDIRCNVLGHMQRGGSPVAWDRLIGTAFGVHAVDLVAREHFDRMVVWKNQNVTDIDIKFARTAYVRQDNVFLQTAKHLGIYIGHSPTYITKRKR